MTLAHGPGAERGEEAGHVGMVLGAGGDIADRHAVKAGGGLGPQEVGDGAIAVRRETGAGAVGEGQQAGDDLWGRVCREGVGVQTMRIMA